MQRVIPVQGREHLPLASHDQRQRRDEIRKTDRCEPGQCQTGSNQGERRAQNPGSRAKFEFYREHYLEPDRRRIHFDVKYD